ncbi:DUF4395 family protein [Maribellus sediminis]|uniref:DUF4395 family protein n=1 Tax=Maribellus sediminis TaxID=2696285 RepID=UPI00143038A8|nr:DUF4395 family protein [Maribellus sediminis]
MEKTQTPLSAKRIYRIKCQGFTAYSDEEITQLAFANRFPMIICLILLGVGVALANIPVLVVLLVVSVLSIVLPYHVFDYLYNHWLRHKMNKPKLHPRSNQLKFACFLATSWTAVNIYLFATGHTTAGYISGAAMFCVPLLLTTTDYCIPSKIYNFLFRIKIQ